VWIFYIFEYLAVFNPRVVSLLPLVSGRVNELILNDPERDIGLIERDFRHFASVSEVCIDSLCHMSNGVVQYAELLSSLLARLPHIRCLSLSDDVLLSLATNHGVAAVLNRQVSSLHLNTLQRLLGRLDDGQILLNLVCVLLPDLRHLSFNFEFFYSSCSAYVTTIIFNLVHRLTKLTYLQIRFDDVTIGFYDLGQLQRHLVVHWSEAVRRFQRIRCFEDSLVLCF
jgi:hypothetical protein